ncbi:MAG: Gfo/Idh/MocA family oxidoreductase [Chloroflexi bacterium]|nr:Gfo/Idh/MocA family oxidoreductase [Chloroflexota bacterium]
MTDKIRWGILSTARIGRRVIPAIQASHNGEVAAVASRSLERAQAWADLHKIPRAYGSYEALFEDEGIDAIYNPLPNSMHAEWSIRCAEAGMPTLSEKPFASDAPEAQSIVDAFEQHDLPLAEAFMYRFHPQHAKAQEIIAAGGIGELQIINSSFTFPISDGANIRLNKALAGGALMDVGCYCVNLMRFMTGEEPEGVRAAARIGERTGVDETLVGTLEFPSGVIGHFDCGLRSFGQHTYTLKGAEGMIVVPQSFVIDKAVDGIVRHWQGDNYSEQVVPAVDQYQLMVEDFADALLKQRPPRFAPADAVKNMVVVDRLLADAR